MFHIPSWRLHEGATFQGFSFPEVEVSLLPSWQTLQYPVL